MSPQPPTLRIVQEKVDFLPPDRVTDDRSILTLKSLVMEPLCAWDNGTIRPALLAQWETDTTGCVWHFHLRAEPLFHDGHRCTAQDIVDFIAAICESVDTFGMKWSYARYFAGVAFVAVSSTTLRVTTARPMGDLPEIFTEFYLSRRDGNGHSVIGTGPCRVTEFTRGARVCLLRGDGATFSIEAVPDAEQRLARLQDGHADIACQLDCLETLPQRSDALGWLHATHCLSVMAYLNCTTGLFQSAEARLAANLALDKDRLCREIYDGLAVPAATIVSPWHCGFPQAGVAPVPYDPQAARAIFDAIGHRGEIVLRAPTFMPEHAPRIAAFIKEALEQVGLRVRIDMAQNRPEYAREIGGKTMGDIAIFDSSPHSTFRVLNDKISSRSRGVWWQGLDDPALEALITTANETLAPAERAARYGACLAALNAEPAWLYLAHPDTLVGTRHGLDGLWLDHKGVLHFQTEHLS